MMSVFVIAVGGIFLGMNYWRTGKTYDGLRLVRGRIFVFEGHHGRYPTNLSELAGPCVYKEEDCSLKTLPAVRMFLWPHRDGNASVYVGETPNDAGGWIYSNGLFRVNCTHRNLYGHPWSEY